MDITLASALFNSPVEPIDFYIAGMDRGDRDYLTALCHMFKVRLRALPGVNGHGCVGFYAIGPHATLIKMEGKDLPSDLSVEFFERTIRHMAEGYEKCTSSE